MKLSADTESALAPLKFTLQFDSNFTFSAQPTISFTGPADAEFAASIEPYTWDVNITEPGIYVFNTELQDDNGVTYDDQVALLVYDRNVLDMLLLGKWDKMKAAMVAGDIEGAVQEFTFGQRQTFRDIFAITGDQLVQMALDMQEIELIYQKNDTAEYRIRRDVIFKGSPETITFYIYFLKGANGIWRIRDF